MGEPFGEYTLIEKVAAGGMAEVWRAEIRGIGGFRREVAIKRILEQHTHDAKFVEMLLDEARISARLTHPGIAQVIQCGEIAGAYYIVMELVDGVAFSRVLGMLGRAAERLLLPAAVHVGVGLLRALDYAHKARADDGRPLRIVHRDVSPHNLLVSVHGEVKLIDFGVAQAADRLHRTETGVLKGKLTYMAPEQVSGTELDARSDQYAAALVITEALTGRRVYGGKSELDVIKAVMQHDAAHVVEMLSAADIPERVVDALRRASQRDPNDRFPDCEAFAAELLAAVPVDVEAVRTELAALVGRVRAESAARGDSSGPHAQSGTVPPGTDTDHEAPTKRLVPAKNASQPITVPTIATEVVRPRRAGGPRGWVRGLVAAGAVALLAVGGRLALSPGDGAAVAPTADAGVTATDARDAGVAIAVTSDAGVVTAPAEAGIAPPDAGAGTITKKEPRPKAPSTGTLDLACLPWCEITIDGRGGLRSPLRAHALPIGSHVVDVVNPPSGKRETRTVEIGTGAVTRVSFRLD